MIQLLIFSLLAAASLEDHFTSRVHDIFPISIIAISLLFHFFQGSILTSLFAGIVTSTTALFMSYQGYWGGADSYMLAAMGFFFALSFPYYCIFLMVSMAITWGIHTKLMNKENVETVPAFLIAFLLFYILPWANFLY